MEEISNNQFEKELVSIIMPVYNNEDHLKSSIESVLGQLYDNWELIIIDDYSQDNSEKIIKKYLRNNNKIRYFRLDENSGAAVARGKGIEASKGQYLAFLDSDDRWYNEKLSKQIKFMQDHNYVFSCTSFDMIDEKDISLNKIIHCKSSYDYNEILKNNPGNSTIIYDASVIGKVTIPNIRKRNDYVMWLKVIKTAKICYGLQIPLTSYRVREGSLSNKKFDLIKYQWHVYRKIEHLSLFKSIYLMGYMFYKKIILRR